MTVIQGLLTLENNADSGQTVVSLARSGNWTTGSFNGTTGASNASGSNEVTIPVPKDGSSAPDAEVVFSLPDAQANGNPGYQLPASATDDSDTTAVDATIRTGSEITGGPYSSGDSEDLVILAEE